jgi:AraC-like DNA-binding protein
MNHALNKYESATVAPSIPATLMHCKGPCILDHVEYSNYTISIVVRGRSESTFLFNDRKRTSFDFLPGSFCAFPPGHHWKRMEAVGETNVLTLSVPDEYISAIGGLRASRLDTGVVIPFAHDRTVLSIALHLTRELETGLPSGPLFSDGLESALIGRVYSITESHKQNGFAGRRQLTPAAKRNIADFIRCNIHDQLNISTLARVVGMGERNFQMYFLDTFKMSVHSYVTFERLNCAIELLTTTDIPVSNIAKICGFSSHSHFTSTFKNQRGETPQQFRARR